MSVYRRNTLILSSFQRLRAGCHVSYRKCVSEVILGCYVYLVDPCEEKCWALALLPGKIGEDFLDIQNEKGISEELQTCSDITLRIL